MKALKGLLIFIVASIGLFALIGLTLPSKAQVSRAITIAAKPATVYEFLNGFQNFNKWSPWAALDPNTQYRYQGPSTGVGAKMSWSSTNPNVGEGSQQITAVKADEWLQLSYLLGDMNPSTVTQTMTANGSGCTLTWTMQADLGGGVVNHWFGLFLDQLVGPGFEQGLAKIKAVIETLPKRD